jgi:predicted RNA-binding protein YlqC (UPF0109 family)
MTAQGDAAGLVRQVVEALVDEADQVNVSSVQDGETTVIEISVAPDEVGKVIGRQGRIIKSIRTLVRAVSSYEGGARIEVEVAE